MKKIVTFLAIILLAIGIALASTSITNALSQQKPTKVPEGMPPRYEYTVIKTDGGAPSFSKLLDSGWQLTGLTIDGKNVNLYFRKKR